MQFFTMAWWCGIQAGDESDPTAGYAVHLTAIRDRLPRDLLATEETISLHDTRLRSLRLILGEATMQLTLDTYCADERFTLTYSGVEQIESTADPEVGLGGPAGYGDLGYCEVDILPRGALEHRLLFSTGIELVVVFHEFKLVRQTKPDPAADPHQ